MTDKAMQVVRDLQNYARQYARGDSLGRAIDGTARIMYMAANLIEKLSAELESDDRQYSRDAFETLIKEDLKFEEKCKQWERRCKAAEQDIRHMLTSGNASCLYCEKFAAHRCTWENCPDNATWRGPCAENTNEEGTNT